MFTAKQIFNETYLSTRAKLLEIAATLDRLDRASAGSSLDDPRRAIVDEAIQILLTDTAEADRAQRLQQLFSRPYDSQWRSTLEV